MQKLRSWAGYGENIKLKRGVFIAKGRGSNRKKSQNVEVNYTPAIIRGDKGNPRSKQSLTVAKVGHCRRASQINGEKEGLSSIIKTVMLGVQ